MRRALLVVALLLTGCGESDNALADAQKGLGTIKRGELSLRLTAGAGESGGEEAGFGLRGRFDMSGPVGSLPKARLELERIGVDAQETTFVSTGAQAWVVANGRETELTGEQLESIRLKKASQGVAGLHLDDWANGSVKTRKGGRADGVAVERITADVDAVKALNDVFTLAGQFGSGVGPISGKAADRLRDAVKSATVEALVGDKDGLLRRLNLDVVLSPDFDQAVKDALGRLAATRLRLELEISRPNQDIGPVRAP